MSIPHNFPDSPHPHEVRFGRADIRAEMSGWLTVVAIEGDLDASNAEQVRLYLLSVITGERPALLQVSSLNFLGVEGLRALWAVADGCTAAGVPLAVVAGHSVRRVLDVADRDGRLPAVDCMVAALDRLRGSGRRLHVIR